MVVHTIETGEVRTYSPRTGGMGIGGQPTWYHDGTVYFSTKGDKETEKKHTDFVARMVSRGYTARQTRRLVEWYMRVNKAG